jgi:hypothetical protein
MAHFAELGEDNVVLRVIVVSNDDCKDSEGTESEAVGAEFCRNLLGGTWKQTSYNGNMRARYAGIGYTYRSDLNAFIAPKPYPSWSLDTETTEWEAPVARPNVARPHEASYVWNETTQTWDEVELPA